MPKRARVRPSVYFVSDEADDELDFDSDVLGEAAGAAGFAGLSAVLSVDFAVSDFAADPFSPAVEVPPLA